MPKQLLHIYKKALKIPENGFFGNNLTRQDQILGLKSKKCFSRPRKGQNGPQRTKIWPGFLILEVV